ncbi:Hypothetical protein R9X50_00041800 [Acrodontium crateriforme]|uniref:HAUS augmin-like complex subunit 1 n=1 Tax=Acrodontium crateriforme TaxID=150365 RepID=A0AAQ3LXG1_9PEZI|nr:Hypothetical protein R9X50_00041800 [Acrodontium crateriforme]
MEGTSEWTASSLFSPSKARAQQAQAKDWALVDDWLARKTGNKASSFERNEETLQPLLYLANLNERADEQRLLIEQVEKASLKSLHGRKDCQYQGYQMILAHLTDNGETSLEALAESFVLLDATNPSETAGNLSNLSIRHYEAREQLTRTEVQLDAIRREHDRLASVMKAIKCNDFSAAPNLPEDTVEWARSAKHLKAKIGEYEERLNAFRATTGPLTTCEDISEQTESLLKDQSRLDVLTTQMKAFQSLPPDRTAAMAKLEYARDELRKLTKQRDQLFEGLVDRG